MEIAPSDSQLRCFDPTKTLTKSPDESDGIHDEKNAEFPVTKSRTLNQGIQGVRGVVQRYMVRTPRACSVCVCDLFLAGKDR